MGTLHKGPHEEDMVKNCVDRVCQSESIYLGVICLCYLQMSQKMPLKYCPIQGGFLVKANDIARCGPGTNNIKCNGKSRGWDQCNQDIFPNFGRPTSSIIDKKYKMC